MYDERCVCARVCIHVRIQLTTMLTACLHSLDCWHHQIAQAVVKQRDAAYQHAGRKAVLRDE